jgi:hypothetical protein
LVPDPILVGAGRRNAIFLEIARSGQQRVGHPAVDILDDGLVDLHLDGCGGVEQGPRAGDSAIQAPLPKSGYAANSEAKVVAAAVVDLVNDREPGAPSWVNTCYSIVAPDDGISVAMVYKLGPDGKVAKVEGSGGLTPMDSSPEDRKREVAYAYSWFENIVHDTFG